MMRYLYVSREKLNSWLDACQGSTPGTSPPGLIILTTGLSRPFRQLERLAGAIQVENIGGYTNNNETVLVQCDPVNSGIEIRLVNSCYNFNKDNTVSIVQCTISLKEAVVD